MKKRTARKRNRSTSTDTFDGGADKRTRTACVRGSERLLARLKQFHGRPPIASGGIKRRVTSQ
jgi:hypothetical protein